MTQDIKVTFIIPKDCDSENDCSEEMQLAFTNCEQHSGGGLNAQWVHETKYKQFEGLTKRDVFVLTEFEGELYNKLRTTKCLLVGPRCLSCCLTEGNPIPSGPEPVFTVAMRGLIVTASGMTKQQKEKIKKKVFWMGGIYNTVLTDDTTHLISDTVLSDKYIKSIEKGIPVMCESWVDAVWEMSLRLNVSASSPEFMVHLLPPFANLQVTTSGISKKDKQTIMKLITENGGTFSGAFQSETTDVVILTKEGVSSEKFKAALEYGKACVLPGWVRDSAAARACRPLARYRVAGASTSSPIAEHRLPDISLNFSRITNLRPPNNFVDETRSADVSTMSGKVKLSQDSKQSNDCSMDKESVAALESLDMNTIKKAGPIFDGFCIWVTGLSGKARDMAAACVSACGGVRHSAAHPGVTHVAAGGAAAGRAAAGPAPVLRAAWLARSVRAGRALPEREYLMDTKPSTPAKSTTKASMDIASPMSKRNLQLLRNLDLPPPAPVDVEPEPAQDDLVNHYLSQPMPEPPKEKTPEPPTPSRVTSERSDVTHDISEQPTEEIEQIFRGIKIEVRGLDEEAICEIGAEIAAAGGVVCGAGARGTHVLVPLEWERDGENAVTVLWVKDCLSQQELLPIEYYHRPVAVPPGAPLGGVVASLSTYSGVQRSFLDELAKLLGAKTQLRFCRRNTANALASTHLICPLPSGDKYLGALKWGLPAVTHHWLLECASKGVRVSETPFLVGDTKAPASSEPKDNIQPNACRSPEPNEDMPLEPPQQIDKEHDNAMLPPEGTSVPKRDSLPNVKDGTPKDVQKDESEMSPASRYIAMARQGLLGTDSQETPKRVQDLKGDARTEEVRTPPLLDALSSPALAALSPTTRRRLQALRRGEMPSDPIKTPQDPFEKNKVPTPDSAFGAALRPGAGRLSPEARKRLWQLVQDLPGKDPHSEKKHTPLSEIRNRFLAQFNGDNTTPPSEHHGVPRKLLLQEEAVTPPAKMAKTSIDQSAGGLSIEAEESSKSGSAGLPPAVDAQLQRLSGSAGLPPAVDAQLQRLSAALTELSTQKQRRGARDSLHTRPIPREMEAGPESQPSTVGWDDAPSAGQPNTKPTQTVTRRFMLSSNVDNREEIIEMIEYLGGSVCSGTELDSEASHLLCAAPGRSEKMLGSVAAGRWVLHPAYVPRSRGAGRFLPEEEYEWGNPLATCLPTLSESEQKLAKAAHRWRKARALGQPGPFSGVRAILRVPKPRRALLAGLLEAGGGVALDDSAECPAATVCLADVKRCPPSPPLRARLAAARVPVCAPVLLSGFLTDQPAPRPQDHCLKGYDV